MTDEEKLEQLSFVEERAWARFVHNPKMMPDDRDSAMVDLEAIERCQRIRANLSISNRHRVQANGLVIHECDGDCEIVLARKTDEA